MEDDSVFNQAAEFDRHYDRMGWITASVLLAASLTALALLGSRLQTIQPAVIVTIAISSILIILIWLWVIEKLRRLQEIRTRNILRERWPKKSSEGDPWSTKGGNTPFQILGVGLILSWISLMSIVLYPLSGDRPASLLVGLLSLAVFFVLVLTRSRFSRYVKLPWQRWYAYFLLLWLFLGSVGYGLEVIPYTLIQQERFQVLTILTFFVGFTAIIVTFRLQEIQSILEHLAQRLSGFEEKGAVASAAETQKDIDEARWKRMDYLDFDKGIFLLYGFTILMLSINMQASREAPGLVLIQISNILSPYLIIGSILSSFFIWFIHVFYSRGDQPDSPRV